MLVGMKVADMVVDIEVEKVADEVADIMVDMDVYNVDCICICVFTHHPQPRQVDLKMEVDKLVDEVAPSLLK